MFLIGFEQNCFICGLFIDEIKGTIVESTKFSDKKIYEFIECFTGLKVSTKYLNPTAPVPVCSECFANIENYDKFCMFAAQAQKDVIKTILRTQNKYKQESDDKAEAKHDTIGIEFADVIEQADEENSNNEEYCAPETNRKADTLYKYTCFVCSETFEKKRDYTRHTKFGHLPEGAITYACPDPACSEEIFISEVEFQLHNASQHVKDFKCPVCSRTYGNRSLLQRHYDTLHSENPAHVCHLCGKAYFHPSSYQIHMMTHTGKKDKVCTQCSRSFLTVSHLNRHLQTHTGEKNHVCHCGARFALKYNLTAHMKLHEGISRKQKRASATVDRQVFDFHQSNFL